jgi:hypothetical protein
MPDILIFDASLTYRHKTTDYTVAFIQHHHVDFTGILNQLKKHFQEHPIPDHILVIAGEYLKVDLTAFGDDSDGRFRSIIPTRYHQENMYTQFVSLYTFDHLGALKLLKGYSITDPSIFHDLFRIGMNHIFCKGGGLISAQESHHFVFPSGKHCDKFLRTGNILIKSQDIYFIAFNLLYRYKEPYEIIYCDTSSINSLAFALVELKRRLTHDFVCPHIESYGSYKGFEKGEFVDRHKALFLISSSTSANIIDRLEDQHIELSRIVLIYCLAPTKHQSLVICDLKKDAVNKEGIQPFTTYGFKEKCGFCDTGSMPVAIQGDVFLLEKPLINKIIFKTTDAPGNLSRFMQDYHHRSDINNVLIKANFYESNSRSSGSAQFAYEVFFDIQAVFEDIAGEAKKFLTFKDRLNGYIHQYVPSNTRYIVHLDDKGSALFAKYLITILSQVVKPEFLPEIIHMNDIGKMDSNKEGAALVVCSTMVSGGNLIYVSKEMRKFSKLSLIYLVGFTRTDDVDYFNFIKNNLSQGSRGRETNSFYSVETIHCNNDYKSTSWIIELDFIRNILAFCESLLPQLLDAILPFFNDRAKLIAASQKVETRGLTNSLFYNHAFTKAPLLINKNFAFFNFSDYDQHVTQADIYFTISTIITKLRHSKDLNRCLRQSEYVRNLIDPENFARFNDGIIQASILRAAHPLELAYDIDKEISKKFLNIISPIIIRAREPYGESFLEFLYAIAIRKLRLTTDILNELLTMVQKADFKHPVIDLLCIYIQKVVIEKDAKTIADYTIKYDLV